MVEKQREKTATFSKRFCEDFSLKVLERRCIFYKKVAILHFLQQKYIYLRDLWGKLSLYC